MPVHHLTIPRGSYTLSADLHRPDTEGDLGALRAVVLSTPGSSVKEQIGANYASRLAARGIAALVFDPGHQGESGGGLRDLEDPYLRSDDISAALDVLTVTDGIAASRIGVLGICAGGGYAVYAARTDHRIRAVGTVVASNIGDAFRRFQADGPGAALDELAEARTEEDRSRVLNRLPWLPDTPEQAVELGITDIDTTEAIRFYRTERGGHPHSTNRRLQRSDALLLGFDAFHLVDPLMTQPLQVIVGGRKGNTGSYDNGVELFEMAPNPIDLMVVDGAGHYEMYDEPEYVDAAVDRLEEFYRAHL